jgi:hypothetical protein
MKQTGILIIWMAFFVQVEAAVIAVPADQPTIQAAVNVAVGQDTVLVSPGTYVETVNFVGYDIVLGSLFLTSGDTSYVSSTIIDADSSGCCVTFNSGESAASRLCGFTLTNGFQQSDFGGGIKCINASPQLDHLRIHHCSAQFGGGMYSEGSSSQISDLLVENNEAFYGSGGGFYLDESPVNIEDSIFRGNSGGHGGGIHCSESSATLTNVQLLDNAAGFGGGFSCWYSSHAVLTDVIIQGNSVQISGGGLNCRHSSAPTLTRVLVSNNDASYGGGVNFVGAGCNAVLEYVTIVDNYASTSGGGIQVGDQAQPFFSHVTVSGNIADYWGDGMYNYNGHPFVESSIFRGNQGEEIYFQDSGDPGTITLSCTDIEGGEEGIITNDNATVFWFEGNFDLDPLFCSPENGEYTLAAGSPCLPGNHPEGVNCGLMGALEEGCVSPVYPITDLAIEIVDFDQIVLSWSEVSGASSYHVYRSTDPYADYPYWEFVEELPSPAYQETVAPFSEHCFYYVTAVAE